MKLMPPYQPPEPPVVTKALATQLAWERKPLMEKASKLCKKGWQIIGSKGTNNLEYQKIYIELQGLMRRIDEIDNLLKLYQEE